LVKEKNGLVPLDLEISIPKQVKDYSKLIIKRRFLLMSRENYQTEPVTNFDCNNFHEDFIFHPLEIHDHKYIKLTVLNIFGELNNPEDIRKKKNTSFKNVIPKIIKVTSKLKQYFNQFIEKLCYFTQLMQFKNISK
jgi:hypothetical protein